MNPDALTRDIIIEKLGFKTETERIDIIVYNCIDKYRVTFDAIGDVEEDKKLKKELRSANISYHLSKKLGYL